MSDFKNTQYLTDDEKYKIKYLKYKLKYLNFKGGTSTTDSERRKAFALLRNPSTKFTTLPDQQFSPFERVKKWISPLTKKREKILDETSDEISDETEIKPYVGFWESKGKKADSVVKSTKDTIKTGYDKSKDTIKTGYNKSKGALQTGFDKTQESYDRLQSRPLCNMIKPDALNSYGKKICQYKEPDLDSKIHSSEMQRPIFPERPHSLSAKEYIVLPS
jgi:hypothetical protein